MAIAINRLHELFTVHMALAKRPGVITALAVTLIASDVWSDYTDRLLRFVDNELGKERVMDAEAWSLLLMTSAKEGIDQDTLSKACMNFTEQLVIESGLDAKSFADIISPIRDEASMIEKLMNSAMLGFAQSCISEHQAKVKGAN